MEPVQRSESGGDDPQSLIEAATVIRDSRREAAPDSQSLPPPRDRTPSAIAGVLVGHHLNHFLLEELIGGGGMGAVFRARDEQLKRTVAVKVIPFADGDAELQRRFRNEAQSAARLDHPHIAQVFDVGSAERWHYIVFEYIRGTNLRDLVLRDGVLKIEDAVLYTMQLADALQHAAERGITHRDVKPSNVVLSGGRIKLVDMGLARSERYDLSADMTASGVTLGTFDYISPEQAKDPRGADIRSDLYSLGCTLFFMLAARPPYAGGTMLQKLLAHGSDPPPDVRQFRRQVSEELSTIIECLLAKDPRDRYQTPADLIDALQEIASRSTLRKSRKDRHAASRTNRLRKMLDSPAVQTGVPWAIGLALLLGIGLALQIQSWMNPDSMDIPAIAVRPMVMVERRNTQAIETESSPASAANASSGIRRPLVGDRSAPGVSNSDPNPDSVTKTGTPKPSVVESDRAVVGSATSTSNESRNGSSPAVAQEVPANAAVFTSPMPAGARDLSLPESSAGTPQPSAPSGASRVPNSTEIPTGNGIEAATDTIQNGDEITVVGDATTFGPLQSRTLSGAITLAKRMDIHTIKLNVPELRTGPIRVTGRDLTIRSGVGGTTLILDESTQAGSVRRENSFAMIDSSVESLELQDLHLQWRQADSSGPLFRIYGGQILNLTACVVTAISDPRGMLRRSLGTPLQSTGPPLIALDQTPGSVIGDDFRAIFEVLPVPEDRGDREASTFMDFNDLVVRGDVNLISMVDPGRVEVLWDNGLLAIGGVMVSSTGSSDEQTSTRRIDLSLDQMVIDAANGLVRMQMDDDYPSPIRLTRSAKKSVFVIRGSIPQFSLAGSESIRQISDFVQVTGSRNAFDSDATLTDPIVRWTTRDGVTQTVLINEMITGNQTWLRETEPRMSVSWAGGAEPSGPWSQRAPSQYEFSDASVRGFESEWLPAESFYSQQANALR